MPPDNLADALLLDEPSEAQFPSQPSPQHARAKRMVRLPPGWVRVPVSWFTSGSRLCPFGQRERLFLLLLHESRWGLRPVTLTSAVAKEIGLSRQERWRYLRQLEADGWVRVERNGRKSVTVRMLDLAD